MTIINTWTKTWYLLVYDWCLLVNFGAIGPGFGPGLLALFFALAHSSNRSITEITVFDLQIFRYIIFWMIVEIYRVVSGSGWSKEEIKGYRKGFRVQGYSNIGVGMEVSLWGPERGIGGIVEEGPRTGFCYNGNVLKIHLLYQLQKLYILYVSIHHVKKYKFKVIDWRK